RWLGLGAESVAELIDIKPGEFRDQMRLHLSGRMLPAPPPKANLPVGDAELVPIQRAIAQRRALGVELAIAFLRFEDFAGQLVEHDAFDREVRLHLEKR